MFTWRPRYRHLVDAPADHGAREPAVIDDNIVPVVLERQAPLLPTASPAPILASRVQGVLNDDPFRGHLFIFRGRRGDMIKLLWADGDGLCLFVKRLERGRFVWPSVSDGKIHLTPAQLAMLLEGLNWKHPQRAHQSGLRV